MKKTLYILLIIFLGSFLLAQVVIAPQGPPERSGGSYELQQPSAGIPLGPHGGGDDIPLTISAGFSGFGFDDNATENGGRLSIPPDPIGAAGTESVIAVVNTMIECRDKTGTLLWRDGLSTFFSALGPPLGTYTFDPKVVWDHYENRFVVVTLELNDTGNGDATDESHILLAVSKTANPTSATAAHWWYYDINSKTTIVNPCWADYPGFEVDEEAIYITNNMYSFSSTGYLYEGVRLWIVDKGVGGGFYTGAAASHTFHDPYAGGGLPVTTMPAQVFGVGGATGTVAGVGTYLVGYSGIWDTIDEYVQIVRVDNPITAPTFTLQYTNVGHIEDHTWGALPDAPQLGSGVPIEVNDRRALDAVWRDDPNHSPILWLTTTILPDVGYDPANAGETTAHYFMLDTSTWPPTYVHQDNIGGDDIAGGGTEVFTFFPSLAVDSEGNAYFGFAASSNLMYCGAYAAGTHWNDVAGPADPLRPTETIAAGTDYYVRTFGAGRNRWGDYSGAALDPITENVWIFNQYAMTRGTPIGGEDGRWGTAWGTGDFHVPVILSSFTAEVTNAGVALNWRTESEIENLGFIIERKEEGGSWSEIVSYKTNSVLEGKGSTSTASDYAYLDALVKVGNTYKYRLADVDYNGVINYNAVRTVTVDIPQFRSQGDPLILLDAYPNPFNPTTSLHYSISENKNVVVEIYDITGQLVNTLVDKKQSAGWHNVQWNGTYGSGKTAPAGLYIGKVSTGNDIKTTKLMLLK